MTPFGNWLRDCWQMFSYNMAWTSYFIWNEMLVIRALYQTKSLGWTFIVQVHFNHCTHYVDCAENIYSSSLWLHPEPRRNNAICCNLSFVFNDLRWLFVILILVKLFYDHCLTVIFINCQFYYFRFNPTEYRNVDLPIVKAAL